MSSAPRAPRHRSTQRLITFATYLATPLAAGAIYLMHRAGGYFATTSLVGPCVFLAITAPLNTLSAWWLMRSPTDGVRLHARAIITAATTAGVVYSVGWGPMLIVAYALGASELLRTAGEATAKPHMLWCVVAVSCGEIGVQLGWLPTLVHPGLSHAMALAGLICLAIVAQVLTQSSATANSANEALRERGAYFESLILHATDMIAMVVRD